MFDGKNYWVVTESPCVKWVVTLPTLTGMNKVDNWLDLAGDIIQAGEAEQIYRIIKTSGTRSNYPVKIRPFDLTSSSSYVTYLAQTVKDTGWLPFFPLSIWPSLEQTPSHLYFYTKEGRLVSDDVSNAGEILRQNHPEGRTFGDILMESVPALSIKGGLIPVTDTFKENKPPQPFELEISLHSDIWFPWVIGSLAGQSAPNIFKLYPNFELAAHNTPRLNRFLSTFRKLVLNFGGNWHVPNESNVSVYDHMISEQGIKLNMMNFDFLNDYSPLERYVFLYKGRAEKVKEWLTEQTGWSPSEVEAYVSRLKDDKRRFYLPEALKTEIRLLWCNKKTSEATKLVMLSTPLTLLEARDQINKLVETENLRRLPEDLKSTTYASLAQGKRTEAINLIEENTGLQWSEAERYLDYL